MSSKPTTTGNLNAGQRVRISDKPARAGDQKTTPYYSFYSGLTGTILHTYPDQTCSVDIERDSLPPAIKKRHEKSESQLREKWLGDSAEDDSNQSGSGRVRGLKLRYTLLLANDDLVPISGEATEPAPRAQKTVAAKTAPEDTDAPPARPTLEEIENRERQYLEELARRAAQP